MKKEYVEYLTPEELEVMYENLTIKDDFIFGKVMENKENCVEMLERLTGNKISDNISINNQKAIKVAVDGKGVRYDVYVEDDARVMYDAEMQQSENKSILPKRSRFYQGLMDLGYLRYIEEGDIEDEYTKQLHSFVAMARHNRKWRVEYMKTFVHDMDVRREGRLEGRLLTIISMICTKLRKGKTIEIIADEMEEDISKVTDIYELALEYAPDFDENKVWEAYVYKYVE